MSVVFVASTRAIRSTSASLNAPTLELNFFSPFAILLNTSSATPIFPETKSPVVFVFPPGLRVREVFSFSSGEILSLSLWPCRALMYY